MLLTSAPISELPSNLSIPWPDATPVKGEESIKKIQQKVNKIEQCAFDGIIVYGPHCEPDIRGNVIANNRKSGIKIMKNAIAHIGGNSLEDIDQLPDMPQVDL